MAFVCPDCKKETLSRRSAEIKVCLKCGGLVDLQNLIEMLKKMGVQKETIDKVRSDIKANIVTERVLIT